MNAFSSLMSRFLATFALFTGLISLRGNAAEFLAASWVPQENRAVLVHVPEGTMRLRMQTRSSATAAWDLVGVVHLEGRAGTLKMRVPDGIPLDNVLVETSATDPFPYTFYQGQNSFRGTSSPSRGGMPGGDMLAVGAPGAADNMNESGATTVEESDIWKWRGRTLYYFNSLRGLQVFDLSDFNQPRRIGGLRMPAVGEDMYILGSEYVALLANRYDYGWNASDALRSEVVIVRHAGSEITESGRVPIDGTFVESRLIGAMLCVVSQKFETITAPNGDVSYESKTQVHAIDLTDPAHPQLRSSLDVSNDDGWWSWHTVVHATADFLFVATDSWREGSGMRTRVHAIDLRNPAQPLAVAARFDLRGQLLSKFQLSFVNGILTTVSQIAGAVVETWDVTAALTGSSSASAPLDSLLVGANESLFGTRFDGDRLYVVTFRRIDPLFCVNTSNPRDLRLLGELEVPGFSTYLEAFADGTRLLSVGVEGGLVAVSLFDVANPARPTMKSRVRFGDDNHWSWSEANYDEKAVGFFRSEGLLVLPVSQWTAQFGYRTGMQVVDATADGLRARGFIGHRFSARRARLFDQTLVSIGGTELVVVDVTDRDHPEKISSLTIAWPVQEALPYGEALVQLENGDSYMWDAGQPLQNARLRVAPKSDRDALTANVDLGFAGEVAGATIRDDTLCVILRSTSYRVIDEPGGQRSEWNSALTTIVVDLADPGGPRVAGSAISDSTTAGWGAGHLDSHWLPDGRLLWYPSRMPENMWFRCMMCPVALDGAGIAADVGGMWWWGGGSTGDFLVVDVADGAQPRVVARESLAPDSESAYAARALLTANDRLLASWTTWRQEGDLWHEESVVQEISFADSAAPQRSPKASVPGTVEGFHRTPAGGTVIFTSRAEVVTNPDNSLTWTSNALFDALAYDGTQAFLLDTAQAKDSGNMPVAISGPHLLVAVQPWLSGDQTSGILHVFGWNPATGKFSTLPDIPTGPGWPSLQERGGFVFNARSGIVDVIAAHQLPATPATATIHVDVPIWDQSGLVLDSGETAAWQPVSSFGVERLDLSTLPQPLSGAQRGPRGDGATEWRTVPLFPLDVVASDDTDAGGALAAADDFRFVADSEAETYAEWQQRWFADPNGSSAFVLSDPDHDGFDNYSEWAFDTSPVNPHSQPEVTAALVRMNPGESERLVLVVRVNPLAEIDPSPIASYLDLTPQISTDLSSWRNPGRDELEIITSPVRRMFVLPPAANSARVFGRLRIQFAIEG